MKSNIPRTPFGKVGLLCSGLFLAIFAALVYTEIRNPSSDAELALLFFTFPASAGITKTFELFRQCGPYLPGSCRLLFWVALGITGTAQAWIVGGGIAWLVFDRDRPIDRA